MDDANATILPGLIWLCIGSGEHSLANILADAAIEGYRKIPGLGPRSPKLGDAAFTTLAHMLGMQAIGQLERVHLHVNILFPDRDSFLSLCNKIFRFSIIGYRRAKAGQRKGTMQQNDAELAALMADHLDHCFGQLVLAYEARLSAFMVRQTGHVQEAEDIVQEAFMQAYFALARYTPQQRASVHLRPWLYKIALNVFYGRLRKTRLSAVALDLSEDGPHLAIEEKLDQQPEKLLERQETLQELETLLAQIPEQPRTVINLYYFAGLSYQEIADLLNMPLGSVKSHLHRGIQRLRKHLEPVQERGQRTHVIRE